jgi:hypothetical protein
LALERELFEDWGPEPIRSLEAARAGLARGPDWRGPLFDLTPPATERE